MARKRQKNRQPTRRFPAVEDQRAEVVTVAWMLCTLTTFGAEVVGGLLQGVMSLVTDAPASLGDFSNVMLFAAGVTGIACLVLTPLVYRFRRTPPPTPITVLAVTVSVLPLAIGILR